MVVFSWSVLFPQNKIKGYISEAHKLLVVSKANPFPALSSILWEAALSPSATLTLLRHLMVWQLVSSACQVHPSLSSDSVSNDIFSLSGSLSLLPDNVSNCLLTMCQIISLVCQVPLSLSSDSVSNDTFSLAGSTQSVAWQCVKLSSDNVSNNIFSLSGSTLSSDSVPNDIFSSSGFTQSVIWQCVKWYLQFIRLTVCTQSVIWQCVKWYLQFVRFHSVCHCTGCQISLVCQVHPWQLRENMNQYLWFPLVSYPFVWTMIFNLNLVHLSLSDNHVNISSACQVCLSLSPDSVNRYLQLVRYACHLTVWTDTFSLLGMPVTWQCELIPLAC